MEIGVMELVVVRKKGNKERSGLGYTVITARLIYHLKMELTLLHSNPWGIFTSHFLPDLSGNIF
jgi:hypothetical protein